MTRRSASASSALCSASRSCIAIPQSTESVGERKVSRRASPIDFTRRPPKARTSGKRSRSCWASIRAFSSRDCRPVRAVYPTMSVQTTARFSVRSAIACGAMSDGLRPASGGAVMARAESGPEKPSTLSE
jgi:hypothetical protein